jgi:murein DD-endopeptidase MepM/ murein hydrolase activator NlpD
MPFLRHHHLFAVSGLLLIAFLFTACSSQLPAIDGQPQTLDTVVPGSTSTTLPSPSQTPVPPTKIPTVVANSPTPTQPISPRPCLEDICIFPGHFVFQPPIEADHNQKIEPSYPYGGTENGAREPHHGVEFINPQGTPVLAAGNGTVVFAGNDSNVEIGWWVNFYGNLVVIQHSVEGFDTPIFTLYGHLSKILVKPGDIVKAGDQIGEVGMTGKALGAHLHFEVREGINDYAHTRNPELWLIPRNQNGAMVGQIFNEADEVRRYPNVKIISLDQPDVVVAQPVPYADSALNGDDVFQEVFAVGNLTPGKYELRFSPNGKTQTMQFEIFPGTVTRVTFHTQY